MLTAWPLMLVATAGVIAGTVSGVRVLRQIPETLFRRLVAALVLILGIYMLVRGIHEFQLKP